MEPTRKPRSIDVLLTGRFAGGDGTDEYLPTEIAERVGRAGQLSDDELQALETDLVAAFDEADGDDPNTRAMTSIAEAINRVRAEGESRAQAESEADAEVEAEDREAVAAAARTSASSRPSLAEIQARRPASAQPRPSGAGGSENLREIGRQLYQQARNLAMQNGDRRAVVASLALRYPDDRVLTDQDARANQRRIEEVVASLPADYEALVAAGGLCAPVNVSYDVAGVSVDERPIRDSLVRFGASRGGISFVDPPRLADAGDASIVWSHANDVEPGSDGPATKPCLRISCGDTTTVEVAAITRCIESGNFLQRFHEEEAEAWLSLALAEQAREAEDALWDSIVAGSTAVTSGLDAATELGTVRRVLRTIALAVAGTRDRHRMSDRRPVRLVAPRSLRDNMREDVAAQVPGDDALGVADAQIAEWFARRGVAVTWSLDGGGQVSGAQAAGALNPWADSYDVLLFPEGSHLFVDGGELDFGLVRDSSLNATNDVQLFAETFEASAFVGVESLAVTIDTCPSGRTSAPVDYDPCGLGS